MIDFGVRSILFNQRSKEFTDGFMELPRGDLLSIYERCGIHLDTRARNGGVDSDAQNEIG
jgi:hypothetical protein